MNSSQVRVLGVWSVGFRALAATLLLLVCFGATDAHAAAMISQANLLSASRSGKDSWRFTYQVTVQNAEPALNSVTITATDPSSSGTIIQNATPIGNVAANASTSATVTFQAIGNQPGANGDYHDSFWSQYLSQLLFEAIPGPGPVAQGVITSVNGGTISVTDPGDPLLGTEVVIPPGALGDPADTITIGYLNNLPASFNADATAAGATAVSKVITLTHLGTTPLKQVISIRVPYSLSALKPPDYPAVVYWEPTLQQYQPVQITSVDQTSGFVTFATIHFSSYVPIGLPNLVYMLSGTIPFSSEAATVNTTFTPQQDGFEARNFSTGEIASSPAGACFGLSSYAAWYFVTRQPGQHRLFQEYATSSDSGLNHVPEEDAIAREIIAKTYVDTLSKVAPVVDQPEVATAAEFIDQLLLTKSPQLVYLENPGNRSAHSVLIYGWQATGTGMGKFEVYDPNYPGVPQSISWSTSSFDTYMGFPFIDFDAYGSHYDQKDLQAIFSSVQRGEPPTDSNGGGWLFNDLQITSPLGGTGDVYPGGPGGPQVTVDAVNGTLLSFTWSCSECPLGTYYLHVFQNNFALAPRPIANGAFGGGPTVLKSSTFASGGTAELFAFVSANSALNSGLQQADIRSLYSAFQRVELQGMGGGLPSGPGNCVPQTGATGCSVTIYSPDYVYAGQIVAPVAVVGTGSNGSNTFPISQQEVIDMWRNVTTPCTVTELVNCLSIEAFSVCRVDGNFIPASANSSVPYTVPPNEGCTGSGSGAITSSYTLSGGGTLTMTDGSQDSRSFACPGPSSGSSQSQSIMSVSLVDGGGSASLSESSMFNGGPGDQLSSSESGSGTWSGAPNPASLFASMGISVETIEVPAGQPLPQVCSASSAGSSSPN